MNIDLTLKKSILEMSYNITNVNVTSVILRLHAYGGS